MTTVFTDDNGRPDTIYPLIIEHDRTKIDDDEPLIYICNGYIKVVNFAGCYYPDDIRRLAQALKFALSCFEEES